MALHEVIVPKTGINIDDVTLLEWLVEEGAQVTAGEAIFLMETEKIEVEVEAEESGWVHQSVAAGATLPIGAEIGVIAASHEEYLALTGGLP